MDKVANPNSINITVFLAFFSPISSNFKNFRRKKRVFFEQIAVLEKKLFRNKKIMSFNGFLLPKSHKSGETRVKNF